ncbi:branched-chain amino acid transport system ATP-binding protein [Xanthobacter flavus]|uniref:ABC transporter ATP-binding protein n=1 Tax=Xanthobacter flavus TaxID=281 RepID=A0A9W6FM00_XANFL|nr:MULTISPECIES: ABC transporter ATP-binding protein [Xanthobacter]MBN8916922.1 ABC transporter ATP-binding protein [Hyphomicrobiales bacterium]MDR6336104.1 branched-chain amino acid transport system ATP-binding protein [Xanthobacter flavus]GLI24870.1 ABC transporter ATP-binding protein [Xanthobacter flavus]
MALLEVSGLSVSYGRVAALSDVSLTVNEGEVVTVLGANGAGKSTLLKAILGAVPAKAGGIAFAEADITRLPPHRRMGAGLVLVPEGRRILITLTVEENLRLGAHMRRDTAAVEREMAAIYDRFPNLAERRHMAASCLSGGEQQMLAIGRAMMAKPRLMMLDEPSLGLSPLFVSKLFDLIRELNGDGLSVLLVEQNTGKALKAAHSATVLELGRVAMAGAPDVLAADPRLQDAYLGGGSAAH